MHQIHRKHDRTQVRFLCKKVLALTLAAGMFFGMIPVQEICAEEAEKTQTADTPDEIKYERIDISTAEQFADFASKCYIDSWSENKYVSLRADIDLSGIEICVVPVFNGIFDGVGHTISGFDYMGDGYVVGLFRYVESQGVIQNLTLKGNIESENQRECIGSLCGVNYGTIKNCTFQGTVSGRDTVGGIAGMNGSTGTITGCVAKGRITGYYSTGGIAGINHGTLNYCANRAGINDNSEWVEEDDEMGTGAGILGSLTGGDDSELYSGVDTGGIAGFSDGVIVRCTNSGTVGYEHTGYNIGGIVGRQSGVVSLSTNNGTVYGRKDIGGIVGQMEPFIEINEAESLRDAVDKLHDLIDKTIDDMQAAKNGVKRDFDVLTSFSDGAVDAADALAEQLGDFVDDNLDQAQAMTDRLDHVMEMTPGVFNDFEAAENSFTNAVNTLRNASNNVGKITDVGDGEYDASKDRRITLLHTVGGYVISNSYNPNAGETVEITAKPDGSNDEYQLSSIKVVKVTGGEEIAASRSADTYRFTMPAENVRVEAYFEPCAGIVVQSDVPAIDKADEQQEPSASEPEKEADSEGGTQSSNTAEIGTEDDEEESDSTEPGETDEKETESVPVEETDGPELSDDQPETMVPGDGMAAYLSGTAGDNNVSDNKNNNSNVMTDDKNNSDVVIDEGSDSSDKEEDRNNNSSDIVPDDKSDNSVKEEDKNNNSSDGMINEGSDSSDKEEDRNNNSSDIVPDDKTDSSIKEENEKDNSSDIVTDNKTDSSVKEEDGKDNSSDTVTDNKTDSSVKEEDKENNSSDISTDDEADSGVKKEERKDEIDSSTVNQSKKTKPSASAAVIRINSNLSGNASCLLNDNKDSAVITVEPSGGYTVDYVELNGSRISSDSGNSYSFPVDGDKNIYIQFRKITTRSGAVDNAKSEIEYAIQEAQDAANKINDKINNSGSISAEELQKMLSATTTVMENTQILADIYGGQAADSLRAVNSDLGSASDHLKSALDSTKSATRRTRDIANYMNEQSDITFTKLGAVYDYNRIDLNNHLQGISDSLKNLSNNASDYSDVVNADLKAVNDQVNVVFNLLADRLTGAQKLELSEIYEDAGDEDIDSIITGRTESCSNKGVIKGDINVGGIAGSMSIDDEDFEDSAAGAIEYEIGRRYITKCLVTDSVNEGYVTSKKNGAGGICGYMNHGIIVDSESYGSVESTEGDYVGGICGESLTIIRRCYALCSVAGNRNVGGIAGYADTLKECYSMADVHSQNGRVGAIAGQISEYDKIGVNTNEETQETQEQKVTDNYYVSEGVHGIDNISYTGVAEPISYQDLLTVGGLPAQFWHLKVIYKIEDTYLGSEEVAYGERLDKLNFPQIPGKEGFYGEWPDVSDLTMNGTVVVEAEYKDNVTVVQSGASETGGNESQWQRPLALVEDIFTEDTILNAAISDRTPPEETAEKRSVVYEVTLHNGGIKEKDSFALRILNPYEDAVVYGYKDGSWTVLESKSRGQYLQVDMTGMQQYFCVVENTSNKMVLIICASAAVAVLILMTVLVKKGRARRKRRKAQNSQSK